MAVEMDADWVMSIDSDEILEDRVTPDHIRRLMKNPDPIISSYMFGWVNHYESASIVRTDKPFTNGYGGGMTGVRMFKIWNKTHRPLFSGTGIGLHCGNSPDYGYTSIKTASVRFRHLCMLRHIDRIAKNRHYNAMDKEKTHHLVGNNNYNHINRSENVSVDIYMPNNGIAGFVLTYEDEIPCFIVRRFDYYFGLCDFSVCVWTGKWTDEDKEWIDVPLDEFLSKAEFEEKYKTGPVWDIAYASKIYNVDMIHKVFDKEEGLAGCRNAAIDRIRELNDGRVYWAFYLDPDESHYAIPEVEAHGCIRRMAEAPRVWAFLFNFRNPVKLIDGKLYHSNSQSMRLFTIDKNTDLKFYGVVHETLEKSIKAAIERGHIGNVRTAPFEWFNGGLIAPPEKVASKLAKYQQGLVDLLNKDPKAGAAWLSLGLTYLNDAEDVKAEVCLERACLLADGAFMPFRELGYLYLRRAKGLLWESHQLCKHIPQLATPIARLGAFIKQEIDDFPRVDCGGRKVSAEFELPDFPYDIIADEAITDGDSNDTSKDAT